MESLLDISLVNCGSTGWKSIPNTSIYQSCGFDAYEQVSCSVKAENSEGQSIKATSPSIRTFCDAPTVARSVSFTTPMEIKSSNRQRWSYSVSWQEPAKINCVSITKYETRYPVFTENLLEGTDMTRDIVVDGDVLVAFYIVATNNDGLSSAIFSQSIRSPGLPPQTTPQNVALELLSGTCVKLTWDPPAYPNGELLAYQVKCTGADIWTNLSSSADNYEYCDALPFTRVRCEVKAVNEVGESDVARSSRVTTDCAEPTVPNNLSPGLPAVVTDLGRERWLYTVTWQAPDRTNCETLDSYTSFHSLSNNSMATSVELSRDIYVDGNIDFSFSVSASNNLDLKSENMTFSLVTPPLRPQVAPREVDLVANSHSCVILSWQLPEYPNGEINAYRVKESRSDSWSEYEWDPNTMPLNKKFCGFQPHDLVEYQLQLSNQAGTSDAATSPQIKTLCIAPAPPVNLQLGSPVQKIHSGRERWEYNVTWEAPTETNCESLTTYSSYHSLAADSVITSTQTNRVVYVDGDIEMTFSVSVENNDGLSSSNVSVSATTPSLRPQLAPQSINLVADSPYCVILTWGLPEYPNGPIQTCEFKEVSDPDWTVIGWNPNLPASKKICGYDPYESVQYEVLLSNDIGKSEPGTSLQIRTLCTEPEWPLDMSSYVTEDKYFPTGALYQRRRIVVNIAENDISTNCESLTDLEFWIEGFDDRYNNGEVVDDLEAITEYTLNFKVTNNENFTALTSYVVTTGELEPSAPSIIVMAANLTCVYSRWEDPEPSTGVITAYQYRCALTPLIEGAEFITQIGKRSLYSCGYNSAELVTCQIKAATAIGYGPVAQGEATIECGKPAPPVLIISDREEIDGSLTITVSWEPTPPGCRRIVNYVAQVMFEETVLYRNDFAQVTDFEVNDLEPYTEYSITLTATNDEGFSNNQTDIWRTSETSPADSPSLKLKFSDKCVNLTATSPRQPNGIVTEYEYKCESAITKLEGTMPASVPDFSAKVMICDFLPASRIVCTVTARNGAGLSPSKSDAGYTNLLLENGELEKPYYVLEPDESSLYTQVQIYPVPMTNVAPEQSAYRVILSLPEEPVSKRSLNILGCQDDSLYGYESAVDINSGCYIAAELEGTMIVESGFILDLGDESTNGDYVNKALKPDTRYQITVGVVVSVDENKKLFHYFESTPFTSLIPPVPTKAPITGCNLACIIGICVGIGVLLLILIIVCVCCHIYRRKRKASRNLEPTEPREKSMNEMIVIDEAPATSGTPLLETEMEEKNKELSADPLVFQQPIAVEDLSDYIEDKEHITNQLEALATIPSPICMEAERIENKGKCKYIDLYPGDRYRVFFVTGDIYRVFFVTGDSYRVFFVTGGSYRVFFVTGDRYRVFFVTGGRYRVFFVTGDRYRVFFVTGDSYRVKLEREEEEGTDFINASYLASYTGGDVFIAAQGPQKATLADFMLMVFQQKPKAIVMVTNLIEYGSALCEQYWPDHVGDSWKFGDITVTLTSCERWADYTIRCLNFSKNGESFDIFQYHFTSWPDKSSPAEVNPFVKFVRQVKKDIDSQPGLLLVHCSAGIGRTGAFIAMSNLVDEGKLTQKVDVVKCVARMRERRPCMVQLPEQYYFLHCALEEYLAGEKIGSRPEEIAAKVHCHVDAKGAPTDLISAEFQRINKVIGQPQEAFMELEEQNATKNRFQDILPDKRHCVYLDGGAYINAVMVGDYRKPRNLICTQLPLSNTVADFWKMVEGADVRIIVQLDQQEASFYPENDDDMVDYSGITITRLKGEITEGMQIITLSVETKNRKREIRLLVADEWTGTQPAYSCMMNYITTLQQQPHYSESVICIADIGGSTKCGLFLTALNAVEMLKREQFVDLYSTVVMARCRRRQFISTIEEYAYLYMFLNYCIEEYFNSDTAQVVQTVLA
ncbi:receptor-type tyrosine-protein phosphatase kappa-like [Watersipora subatra]|uniref:receptor-type tyrosine-protein phosphatase kappa-like n=1 Tax=Watersipora subatra TaxID=2589382 RepID=UPI00355B495B